MAAQRLEQTPLPPVPLPAQLPQLLRRLGPSDWIGDKPDLVGPFLAASVHVPHTLQLPPYRSAQDLGVEGLLEELVGTKPEALELGGSAPKPPKAPAREAPSSAGAPGSRPGAGVRRRRGERGLGSPHRSRDRPGPSVPRRPSRPRVPRGPQTRRPGARAPEPSRRPPLPGCGRGPIQVARSSGYASSVVRW